MKNTNSENTNSEETNSSDNQKTEEEESAQVNESNEGIKMSLADVQAITDGIPPSIPADPVKFEKIGKCQKCGWTFVNEQVKETCSYCGGKIVVTEK